MDGEGADPNDRVDPVAIGEGSKPPPAADEPEGPEGQGTPLLALDGFNGPLARLLTLARAQQVDLANLPLTALLEQMEAALRQAPAMMPLGQKADWVVMAAWLLQLRSLLLLPADAPAQQNATAEADQLQGRLFELQAMQGLAAWLECRPQLGCDVFACGQPEVFGVSIEPTPDLDIIEFLWASLALFNDGEPAPDTGAVYRPVHLDLHSVAKARDRIMRWLGETQDAVPFEHFLPDLSDIADADAHRGLRRRSAWSSTLIASLELARQGALVLRQDGDFKTIHVAPV